MRFVGSLTVSGGDSGLLISGGVSGGKSQSSKHISMRAASSASVHVLSSGSLLWFRRSVWVLSTGFSRERSSGSEEVASRSWVPPLRAASSGSAVSSSMVMTSFKKVTSSTWGGLSNRLRGSLDFMVLLLQVRRGIRTALLGGGFDKSGGFLV